MSLSRKQYALIKVATRELNLTDADYRSILVNLLGATSATEIDRAGFDALIGFFEYLGFKPLTRNGPDYGPRPRMASFAQIELIRRMWTEYTQCAGDDELNKWLLRSFKVSSLRFLSAKGAQGAITALKHMKARAA